MYNNATIISLEPSNTSVGSSAVSSVRSATFEEAFGEYSELRGGRRKKRQDRRMDRIEARKERKTGRIEGRKAKRLARVESRDEVRSARQDKRIARKTDRKLGRQTRRTDVMEARQGRRTGRMEQVQDRRTARKGKRIERRALGQEDDFETEDTQTTPVGVEPITRPADTTEQGGGYSDEQSGGGYSDEQGGGYSDEQGGGSAPTGGGSAPTGGGSAPTGGGYSDEQSGGGYSDEQSGGYSDEGYSDEQEGDYSDEGYSDEQGGGYSDEGEDSGDYSDESEMGDYETEDEGYDYSEPFDGIPVDASFSEMDDSGKASKKISVKPKLQDLVNKIEWNKELVTRLEAKRTQGVVNPSEVSKSIIDRKRRIKELQGQLEMYLGFAGDYSGANGMSEREVNNEVAKRRMEVGKARQIARAIRRGNQDERFAAKITNRSISAKMKGTHGGDITPVDIDLKPEFSNRRIVVPASEFGGTGIRGIDDAGDFDAREIDIKLGADGDMREPYGISKDFYYGANGETTRKINWTGVILGVAVGALAIYGIKKYNLLKK
jgi:hypothetical protein